MQFSTAPFVLTGIVNRKLTLSCARCGTDRMRLEAILLTAIPWITDSPFFPLRPRTRIFWSHSEDLMVCRRRRVQREAIDYSLMASMDLIGIINLAQITGQNARVWCGRARALRRCSIRAEAREPTAAGRPSIQCVVLVNMCRIESKMVL